MTQRRVDPQCRPIAEGLFRCLSAPLGGLPCHRPPTLLQPRRARAAEMAWRTVAQGSMMQAAKVGGRARRGTLGRVAAHPVRRAGMSAAEPPRPAPAGQPPGGILRLSAGGRAVMRGGTAPTPGPVPERGAA